MNRTWTFAALAVGISALWACSAGTRHEALTFFFDGAPPLGGEEQSADSAEDEATSPTLSVKRFPERKVAFPNASRHAPYRRGQCHGCHDPARGLMNVAVGVELCDPCHGEQRKNERWDHGPIALGACAPCHRTHSSPHPALLDKPIPELCVYCHGKGEDGEASFSHRTGAGIEAEKTGNMEDCSSCHAPHVIRKKSL